MPANTRPGVVSFAFKTLSSALACAALCAAPAHAAGLGKLTVQSAMGQPLHAEIELTAVTADEADALVARLAPIEAFRLANIEFNPTLLSLRFAVEQRYGRKVISVTSSQPINEPFVDMLLELSFNNGRMVREYTFLLDPAEMRQAQAAQVAAPDSPRAPQVEAAAPDEARAAAKPARKAPPKKRAGNYRVKGGDTLGRIASLLKPTDISLDVMLVALYRANPDAFIGNNMNRLRSGQILTLPDADALGALAEGEARGVVVAHAANFSTYRNKLAGQVAMSRPAKAAETGQSAAGKISAKVEERATPANAAKDQLKLSKATPTASSAAAGKTAAADIVDKITKDQQVADATARVKELEKNVSDLEKLMEVKNQALLDQKKLALAQTTPVLTPPPLGPVGAPAPVPAASQAASAPAVPEAVKPKPKPKHKAAPVKKPEPTILDTVAANIVAIGGGLAALLAAIALLVMRRRKKKEPAPAAAPTEPALHPAAVAEPAATSPEANNSVFNSNFAPTASQLDTNEVDPIAEADVYIAYGRDAQAEEILKEALRTHPERHPVRLKLLEIYAARKDVHSFEIQAGELYVLTRGQGEEWPQAAALGLTIDPLNSLYAGAVTPPAPPPAPSPKPAQPPVDDFDLAGAAPDLDFEPVKQASPATPTPTPAAVEDDGFLDFDLGGLNLDTAPASSLNDTPGPAETTPSPDPLFDMAFDLPAEFSSAPAAAAKPTAAETPTPLPDPLTDLDLMNFDLPAMPVGAAAANTAAAAALADEAAVKSPAPEFDLTGIDLDLDMAEAGAAPAKGAAKPKSTKAVKAAKAAPEPEPVVDEAQSAVYMEMETKLDLATAYQEIGDKEGARELIDEVIKDGSEAQVKRAKTMRTGLE